MTHDDGCSDEDLVDDLVSGSCTALGVIFERYGGSVRGLARQIVRDAVLADDVTQDVFIWLMDHAERFDPTRGSLAAYLLLRCRSRSLDVLRSQASRRHREQAQHESWRRLLAPSSEVEAVAIKNETRRVTLRLLDNLPAVERDAVRLAFFGDRSYKTVATELGIPEGTAKSRIRSGLRHLRSELELQPAV